MKTLLFVNRIKVWLRYLLKAKTLYIYLKSGVTLKGKYYEDNYEEIYDSWYKKREYLTFLNTEVKVSEVSAIRWKV